MSIPVNSTAQFMKESGTSGVVRGYLVEIAELCTALKYSGVDYDAKRREIVLHKDSTRSKPLPAASVDDLQVIYDLLWFAAQVNISGLNPQLAELLKGFDQRLKTLEGQPTPIVATPKVDAAKTTTRESSPTAFHSSRTTQSTQSDADLRTAMVPIKGTHRQTSSSTGNEHLNRELQRLRQQAMAIEGILTANGQVATYRRPECLEWETALDCKRRHQGARVRFALPDELPLLAKFIAHDQATIVSQCIVAAS